MFIRKFWYNNIVWIFLILPFVAAAQSETAASRGHYAFLKLDQNKLYEPDDKAMQYFYRQVDTLIRKGDRQVNILQIGDSHIQAGFFPNSVRNKLQSVMFFGNGGRGFIFPYKIAKTNNPWNYKIAHTGEWEYCKNIQRNVDCPCGISGITVTTRDTSATLEIYPNVSEDDAFYGSTRLRIFHKNNETSFKIILAEGRAADVVENELYTEFTFSEEYDTIKLKLAQTEERQVQFQLYGLSLETDYPGVVYSSVGVNGADIPAFLRCELLAPQLEVMKPDLVIISLGTNDAYMSRFDAQEFKRNYTRLIGNIQKALPEASIILTTPGDGYRQRKYYNYNYTKTREVIYELSKEKNVAVWDFYTVMGGPNSIYQWYKAGLAQGDKIHLTMPGYKLQGELFYDALLKSYYKYLDNYPAQ